MPRTSLLLFFLISSIASSFAQDLKKDSLRLKLKHVYSEIDSIFNTTDTLLAVDLIDDFLNPKILKDTSKLLIRVGYNSNISAINQTLGIKQLGVSPGIAYYHSSGLYADISSYWSKQFLPPVYLTVFSAGYMKVISPNYLFNLEYSYFLYPQNGQDSPPSYTHSFSLANQFDFKPIQFKLDYYYYFGTQSAHRVLPSIGLTLEKKNWKRIQRASFQPSFGVMIGTESTQNFVPLQLTPQQVLDRIKNGQSLYKTETITVFGLMNYSFNFPLNVRFSKWTFLLSYTYNIPKSLPDEELSLTNTGYLSASVVRYINLK